MAFTIDEINYYHDRGQMPDWAWVQQNGRSPEWNYNYQKQKMYAEMRKREKAKQREEAKKQIEKQILDAIAYTMMEGEEQVANAAANDIISSINATFGGGSINTQHLTNKSFSANLGAILGRALGEAPFKLLDEIFKDDDY